MSSRRRDFPPSGGNNGNSKLRMDRKPNATRMSDPSHPAGRRKEIDNVMKKARQAPHNEYWDKKLLEVEEKDPNRWRHTGYKKLYGGGGNGESSGSDRDTQRDKFRYNGAQRKSRSPVYRRSPPRGGGLRRSPAKRSPIRKPRSPVEIRRRSPLDNIKSAQMKRPLNYRTHATVSKRPPSPPSPKARSPSVSSGSDDSYSGASDDNMRAPPRSRSRSLSIARPRSYRPVLAAHPKDRHPPAPAPTRTRPISNIENEKLMRKRIKVKPMMTKEMSPKRRPPSKHHRDDLEYAPPTKSSRQPPEPAEPAPTSKKSKEKPAEKLRTRVKIEGESRRRSTSSSESNSSENSIPATLTATTRLTLSERFGKMAQNFSFTNRGGNMEKMQITKNSAGGDLKVLIQEGVGTTTGGAPGSPPRKHSYSPAPQGHFPEELLSQAPTGNNANWEDVRVRFEYYKGRGYLRDLDLNDYIKWEEWWYRYQEWLKQERYYEMYWEKQSHMRRKRKIPIAQRLN